MRHFYIKQILLTMAVLLCSATAKAYDFEVDGIYYNIISATDFTAKVTTSMGEASYIGGIIIPSSVNYNGEKYSVTSIGGGAFWGSSLGSIELPSSVKSIETYAFKECSNLTSVVFGDNFQLTYIGDGAFSDCTSLTSIELPNSVTYIGIDAFHGCSSLTSIELPNSVTEMGNGAFGGCSSLTSIEIPNSVTEMGDYTFEGCSNLKTVTFGENFQLTYIEKATFEGCTSLTNIEIPNSVKSIRAYAFEDCTSLTNIEIPNSVIDIDKAFAGCTSLKELFIEDGYATLKLEGECFYNCPLETIYLGRNLSFNNNFFDGSPFPDMITLKTSTIGGNVTKILGNTFYDCSNLESIYMKGVPPIITDNTFSNASYYNATVYVPQGTLAFYQSANVWKNFWNIQEYEPASIEDTDANTLDFIITSNGISLLNADNSAVAIYSINGILVEKIDKYTGEEIILNEGVYIVCVGNTTMKIKL